MKIKILFPLILLSLCLSQTAEAVRKVPGQILQNQPLQPLPPAVFPNLQNNIQSSLATSALTSNEEGILEEQNSGVSQSNPAASGNVQNKFWWLVLGVAVGLLCIYGYHSAKKP